MRVFITDLGSSLSTELARNCQDAGLEVVGTASRGGKSEVTAIKRQLQSHASSDVAGAVKEPIALQTDVAAWRRLVQQADVVVVTSLAADPKLAMETLKVFEKRDMTKGDDEAKEDEGGESVKRFIAVSSVLSWSKNSPFAASGTDSGHVEDDFKSRRPARKYTDLKTAETQILSAHRTGDLETCIVGAGLIYGGAQSQLQLIFREAWLHPDQPLLVPSLATQAQPTSQGRNLLPMISLYDLALLVFRVAASPSPPPKKYLLAVDRASGSTSLRDVCRGVSTLLASGHLRDREDSASAADAKADALLLDEEEELVTPLQVHLRFDTSAGAMHTLVAPEEWRHYSRGLLGNLVFFFDDFINAMDLRPLRTIILGAPRAGKTMLSRKLAADYYLPYLQQGNEDTQKLREELQQWAPTAGDKASQLPEKALVALVRWKLRSAACRNQGYVLDGLPISSVQAKKIFSQEPNTDTNNADGAAAVPAVDVEAMLTHLKPRQLVEVPNRVIVLQAPRALLEIRAQALSEAEAERTENTQDAFARRFDEFESNIEALEAFFEKPKMTKEVTAEGVEVLELSLRDEHGYRNDAVFAAPIQRYVEQGDQAPRNFHPTRAELREQRRAAEKQARAAVFRSAQLIREQDAQDEAAQQAKIARERARLELLQCEEAELLETRAKPLRTYLMDTVLPALTEGMLEVVKVQPTDPIDYLAEFLFRKGQELEAELSEA
ncbi:adenylate kinase, putative [Phytophthora infestans T30-4]|uniref:Adenylate kinase, putative n=1 Tax=Phytophthora infestans (strain T30-4) TaxID=403677 RepID=D0P151_PHYIT|nr:adenylate kinase, putative [Phytophthora infestans T30-4]EEY54071.1 adenylate kinase, putative [Phytophthora infestans T30-4]|eukprot:XP_002895972.1 adenylate kinase, putative [Phytophthora infestans T30-4]